MRSLLTALIASAVVVYMGTYIVAQPNLALEPNIRVTEDEKKWPVPMIPNDLGYTINIGEDCPDGWSKSYTLGDTIAKCSPTSGYIFENPGWVVGPAEADYHCAIPKGMFNATDIGLGRENPCRCEYIPSDRLLSCYCRNGGFELRIDD